jgi:hypothetical protein
MIDIGGGGRFGNQFIRNLAMHFIMSKFDLCCTYQSHELMKDLGINLYSGTKSNDSNYKKVDVNDDTYFDILNLDSLNGNITNSGDYFQTKDITNMIKDYLHRDDIKECIEKKNPFTDRYRNNNDIFIHIRLGDVADKNPGLDYYICAISKIESYDNIYISTDSRDHYIIQQILNKYRKSKIIYYDEVKTFQFGSTCKNIILSHGSFSACIGYLAFYSTIYYPQYNLKNIWYGDMFSIEGWNEIPMML